MRRFLPFVTMLAAAGPASAQDAMPALETVPIGQALVMLLFLLVAAMIVVSILCKIVVLVRLVPAKPTTRVGRIVHWLARVVGNVRYTQSRESTVGSGRSGGGGAFGGGGSSGNF